MGIQTIGDAIKTALASLVTAGALQQVFAPDEVADSVNLFPVALILPGTTNYHATHGDQYQPTYQVLVLIAKMDAPSALAKILPLMEPTGTSSIKAAIETDRTLGGVVDDVKVVSNNGFSNTTWSGYSYLSTQFDIQVIS